MSIPQKRQHLPGSLNQAQRENHVIRSLHAHRQPYTRKPLAIIDQRLFLFCEETMSEQLQPPPEVLFNNLTHTAKALGLAMSRPYGRRKATVHYVSFAGTNTACESIRASLHKKDARLPFSTWSSSEEYIAPHMKLAKARLPDSAEVHMLMWDPDPAFIVVRDDRYFALRHIRAYGESPESKEKEDLTRTANAQLARRLVEVVNALTPAPVLPEWSERLLDSARNQGFSLMRCYGDCIAAILVDKGFDWVGHIQSEMRKLYISIPPLPADLVQRLADLRAAAAPASAIPDGVTADPGDDLPVDDLVGEDLASSEGVGEDQGDEAPADPDDTLPGQPLEDLLAGAPLQIYSVDLRRPLFALGQLVATPGFLDAAGDIEWVRFLERHVTGDWREQDDEGRPELDPFDISQNRSALNPRQPQRILSAFWLPTEPEPTKFWIITEHDRSVTTCLLPSEY